MGAGNSTSCGCCAKEDQGLRGDVTPALRDEGGAHRIDHPIKVLEDKNQEMDALSPKLTLVIVGTRGLQSRDCLPSTGQTCYCTISVSGKEVHRTKSILEAREPLWEEECQINVPSEGEALKIRVHEMTGVNSTFRGECELPVHQVVSEGFNGLLQLQNAGTGTQNPQLKLKAKLLGNMYPPGPPCEFQACIARGSTQKPWGLDVNYQDTQTLFVLDVLPGAFEDYNKVSPIEKQVQRSDFIISVNGVTGNGSDLKSEMTKVTKIELVLRRPQEQILVIKRADAKTKHGMEFARPRLSSGLVVLRISEGFIQDHNKAADESMQLKVGDRIVSAEYAQGPADDLVKRLDEQVGDLHIGILRTAAI
jgi:hypothetical protein